MAGRELRSSSSMKQEEEMASSIAKSLLQSKELRSMIQNTIKEAVKTSLDKLTNIIDIHEGRIHDLECRLDESSKELSNFAKENQTLKSKVSQLSDELNVLEQYSRRNCVRIFGLSESAEENTDDLMKKLAHDKLGVEISDSDIDRSHRIGKPDRKGHRAIIVKFTNYSSKQRVLKARRKLKSSGIVIQEDLTTKNRALLKKANEHPKITSAWSIDGKIFGLVKTSSGTETKRKIAGLSDLNNL